MVGTSQCLLYIYMPKMVHQNPCKKPDMVAHTRNPSISNVCVLGGSGGGRYLSLQSLQSSRL